MKTYLKKNKFLSISVVILIVMVIVDYTYAVIALEKTLDQLVTMLLIVPPIFVLIGLFDVWVPRETVIKHMGENSKLKGLLLAFFIGAFSAGPTIAAFPIAMMMLKKGAKYSNVFFFLMVWSSLKLPIVLFQVTTIGLKLSLIINLSMLFIFLVGVALTDKIFTKEEINDIETKAIEYSKA